MLWNHCSRFTQASVPPKQRHCKQDLHKHDNQSPFNISFKKKTITNTKPAWAASFFCENQKAWSIQGHRLRLSLMCLCWRFGKWESGECGWEGTGRKDAKNREGEEVCGWTVTALNSFLIGHFYILFRPSWRHLMQQPRRRSRMRRSSTQINLATRKSPNIRNVYLIHAVSFYYSPISCASSSLIIIHQPAASSLFTSSIRCINLASLSKSKVFVWSKDV